MSPLLSALASRELRLLRSAGGSFCARFLIASSVASSAGCFAGLLPKTPFMQHDMHPIGKRRQSLANARQAETFSTPPRHHAG